MDATSRRCLDTIVDTIHTTVLATIGPDGYPHTCAADMMLADDEGLYFLTARGKSLYRRLSACGRVSLTGVKGEDTMSSVAVSLVGDAEEIGQSRLGELLDANPYMLEIYPTEGSRSALTVFHIHRGSGEVFDLSKKPIERTEFTFGGFGEMSEAYVITDACDGCGSCVPSCPQSCIDTSSVPFRIAESNCLRCGNCMRSCPNGAVIVPGSAHR